MTDAAPESGRAEARPSLSTPGQPGGPPSPAAATPAIEGRGLRVWYPIRRGVLARTVGYVKAVDGVDLDLAEGEPLRAGTLRLFGADPSSLGPAERRRLRLKLQVVFQDPFASLNPRHTVVDLLTEAMVAHGLATRRTRDAEARCLLAEVGLPGDILDRYPHAFSGGQRQRIAIARALALSPRAVICDEAVSALDLSVRAQILNLLLDLRDRHGLSYLFITHDIGVVAHIADRIAVMRRGRFVETGSAADVLENPRDPYTHSLIASAAFA